MNKSDILVGKPLKFEDGITFEQRILKEILDIDEQKYLTYCSFFHTKPNDVMVELDDQGIDFEEIGDYELFIMMTMGRLDEFNKAMDFFARKKGHNFKGYKTENGVILCSIDEKAKKKQVINEDKYKEISDFIIASNCFKKKAKEKFRNSRVKKLMIESERRSRKIKERNPTKEGSMKETFPNYISSIMWYTYGNLSYEKILNMTVYQLMDGLARIGKIQNYNNLMNGHYSGTIDINKLDDKSSLDWYK